MWYLVYLSLTAPAFAALAKESRDGIRDGKCETLRRDAEDCYSDIVNIGLAISRSKGEWSPGLRDDVLVRFLEALETRFPKSPAPWRQRSTRSDQDAVAFASINNFPRLRALAKDIRLCKLGGFLQCSELFTMPTEQHDALLERLRSLSRSIELFRGSEIKLSSKRQKFLRRVKEARKHLHDIYCSYGAPTGLGTAYLSLSQHPSHSVRSAANEVYGLIKNHWQCTCPQQASAASQSKEVRLGLKSRGETAPGSPLFELLLPICENRKEWKEIVVEVEDVRPGELPDGERVAVDKDICRWIKDSDCLTVKFLVERGILWHLKPDIDLERRYDEHILPLCHLLGGAEPSLNILAYTPEEQHLLCYSLADSVLWYYPGSWLRESWSSSRIFLTKAQDSDRLTLCSPYLSVRLTEYQGETGPPPHMQSHRHPVILALGIMLLEIVTGSQFPRSDSPILSRRCNDDHIAALQLLNSLERRDGAGGTRFLTSGLRHAIRSCLRLEPLPNLRQERMSEEGPIRHHILTNIVRPLALQLGFGGAEQGGKPRDDGLIQTPSTNAPATTFSTSRRPQLEPSGRRLVGTVDSQQDRIPWAWNRDMSLYGQDYGPMRTRERASADRWFEWHHGVLQRIRGLREGAPSDDKRVKIAILDSGLELSEAHKVCYDFEPRIKYRSWVSDPDEKRDEAGHGTHLSILLRKIAPEAVIHVARVFRKNPGVKDTPKRIVRAIHHAATEWKVDIVVMAFGFGEKIPDLSCEIKKASDNGILFFAAASNDGRNLPGGVAWPARDPDVVCVHSADGHGFPSRFTPRPLDNMRLMTLGEGVVSAWPPALMPKGSIPSVDESGGVAMSGTSCATVVAAGIAAVVMDYARGSLTDEQWRNIHRADCMRNLLGRMNEGPSGGRSSDYNWVMHWAWFQSRYTKAWIDNSIGAYL
ncbi:hypothetical protein MAPG_06721 [Magnaporthiopsis poae ATCC 64411]|uniref:Uncharacterized protein n=1 Tax=Magnaporthiopsis poae (strain ATCC 64411 / 73-15) TaxID=644358 RepID=A0A0C4E2T1_MAGP6|nr:hypothetical protein MAPG_06721 [Magnaporthiopsis poae ATCC 64411]